MTTKHLLPYGSWPSPISAEQVAWASTTLDAVQMDGLSVYWVEGGAGGDVLVSRSIEASDGELRMVLPEGIGVGSSVHEYGGGAYLATSSGVWFSRPDDNRIWRTTPDGLAPVTALGGDWRFADMRITTEGLLVCIRERHEPGRVIEELVAMPALSCTEPRVIASGWDFYSFPRPSPDGRRLAWTSWRRPFMPWDATWLWVADIGADGRLSEPRHVAGGPEEAVFQPEWSPDGVLHFVSDRSGWWNLYCWDGREVESVVGGDAEMGVAQWELGYATYAFVGRQRIALLLQDGPYQGLAVWDRAGRQLRPLEVPYTSYKPYLASNGRRIGVVAAAPDRTPRVALIDPVTADVREVAGTDVLLECRWISMPERLRFVTRDGSEAHATFYPPTNPEAEASDRGPPPLLVRVHPGPTASTSSRLDLWTQFFTTRGFAVADVDHRGSTGYGRAYRCALRGRWGLADVSDCVYAVAHLAEAGRIDPSRVAISGASAGGYTALRALTTTSTFIAGVVRSAVVDPALWRAVAPRFQAHQVDMLIGPWPEAQELYNERSILWHAHDITSPLLIVHGDRDRVTPLRHTRFLSQRSTRPGHLLALTGEGHVIRRPSNIARALRAELAHYLETLAPSCPAASHT